MLFKSFIDARLLTYFDLLLPLIIWQNNDDKEIVKAMTTKLSENFGIVEALFSDSSRGETE